jgi:hypothetical protein
MKEKIRTFIDRTLVFLIIVTEQKRQQQVKIKYLFNTDLEDKV